MTAILPLAVSDGDQIFGKDLREMWNAARFLSNIGGYSSGASGFVTGGGATTNTLIGTLFDYEKFGSADETYILAFVSVSYFWASGATQVCAFGVGMGNGQGLTRDTDCCVGVTFTNSHHDSTMGVREIDGIPAGIYTPGLYYRVNGGTLTMNADDTATIYLIEVPYGGT